MKHSIRNWHTWVSVALGIPLLLVGLTTVFIAHEKSLGTKQVIVASASMTNNVEIRGIARIGGETWLGTKQGVFRMQGSQALPIEGTPAAEVRGIVAAGNAVLIAANTGLWRHQDGKSSQLHADDCWQVAADATGYLAACKRAGLLSSATGATWTPAMARFAASDIKQDIPLSKIIMDIHTGKLFFGEHAEWIWIDVLGISMVGLALTGLVMWMRGRRQRAGATANDKASAVIARA